MGAYSGSYDVKPSVDLHDWFEEEKQRELYENGHSPYSGTLATNTGIVVYDDKRIYKAEEARELELKLLDESQKWDVMKAFKVEHPEDGWRWRVVGWHAC